MPMAASSSAEQPNTVISHMLNFCRDTERETTSAIERTSETGRPVDWRSCSWMALLIVKRLGLGPDQPGHRREPQVEHVHRVGHLRLRNEHHRSRLVVEAAVARVADDADDLPVRLLGELAHDAAADGQPLAEDVLLPPSFPSSAGPSSR